MIYWCDTCKTMENTMEDAKAHKCKGLSWGEVNDVIKWTLENARHLEYTDVYDIEKATDNCHLMIMKNGVKRNEHIVRK